MIMKDGISACLNLEIRKKIVKSQSKGVSWLVCLKTWAAFSPVLHQTVGKMERLNRYCQL